MNKNARFWDKAADKYAKSKIGDPADYERTLARIRHHLKPTDKVLEVGCGTASTAILLAPLVEEITASDISTRMSEIGADKARAEGLTKIRCVTAEIGDPRLGEHSYDAILALNLLHLLPDMKGDLAHIHKMLEPGGLFLSKTATMGNSPLWFRLVIGLALPLMRLFGKAPYVTKLTHAKLERAMREAGFQIIEASTSPNIVASRFLVAQKVS